MEKQLVAGYFGMGGNSFMVTHPGVIRNALAKAGYRLLVCTEWDYPADSDFEAVKWGLDTWRDTMRRCDVVLAPQRVDVQPAKSAIKVTVAMAMGIPVIASPLEAYTKIIKNGVNGYIAGTEEEWTQALEDLKSLDKRRAVAEEGIKSVGDYTLESVANKWITLCKDLVKGTGDRTRSVPVPKKTQIAKPKPIKSVDIIIPVYNNVEYLKLCISSIKLNTTYPHNIILSDAGSGEETWGYLRTLRGFTVLGEQGKRLNFSQAVNAAVARSNTEYFLLLNSDVLVSRGYLEELVDKMESVDRLASCGVLSNCDRGWTHGRPGTPQYDLKLPKSGIELVPGMKMEQILPHLDELYSHMEKLNVMNKGKFIKQSWIAYYATMFARSAWNEVGGLDPDFQNGCEDLCHQIRLAKGHYASGQAIGSFVYHFGGVSRGAYEKEASMSESVATLISA